MNILFVHQNFPAQYKHLAPALASAPGNRVMALHVNPVAPMEGVESVKISPVKGPAGRVHRWVSDFDSKVIRGEAAYHAARQMKASGFTPDVILAHSGWGESLFLQDVWPAAPIGLYCEFYYSAVGADVNFDPEFGVEQDAASRLRVKNSMLDMQLPQMTSGIAPTLWQRSTFPDRFRPSISVIHDGIDTDLIVPNREVGLNLRKDGQRLSLKPQDEVITFIVRNLEPYRGYHSFMRALPEILRRRPKAQILIIGGDDVSYGPRPNTAPGQPPSSWKNIYLDEVRDQIDMARVHFFGRVPYAHYLAILQLSTVHVYLTYPFVLSWSLLEAMSAGCAIVASDTAPVREAIQHGETGRLVDFFAPGAVAEEVIALCESAPERSRLGHAARRHAIEHFDLKKVCLPSQMVWFRGLAN